MGRRSAGSGEVSSYQGRFHRTLGKVLDSRDQVVPKKFLLGTDRRLAESANLRLQRLWDEVVAEHEATVRWMSELGGNLADSDSVSGRADPKQGRRVDHGPVWRAESLLIAEAIRRGEHQVVVQVGQDGERPYAYLDRFDYLRRTYSVVAFIPASTELYLAGQQAARKEAGELVQQAQDLAAQAQVGLPEATGQTLYQALDDYAAFAVQKNPREAGRLEANNTRRLKHGHADIPLEQFGISVMEKWAAYWASRPPSKKTGRPVALGTVNNQMKTARAFVRWLHRTDAFKWSKPIDAEQALRVQLNRLRNDAEIAALGKGVAVWSVDELATLYRYATDRERMLILLGLNCGFAQAEFCTLRHDEIFRERAGGVIIKRVRRKSHVYGEFVLWPQTVSALDWFHARSGAPLVKGEDKEFVLLTQEGNRYDRQRLANIWGRLLDRVEADLPSFRRLSFKRLRKTGGELVRQRSDGEIAGVFLCHGRPVASDQLSDVYTNRPFGKVAAALRLVHEDLRPVFDAAPDAFKEKGASSSKVAETERIQKLHTEGVSQAETVHATNRMAHTVRRRTSPKNSTPELKSTADSPSDQPPLPGARSR